MSIKQRLEYGIFPIASRRHQPRENWGTFHEFPHQFDRDESLTIIWSWILTIPIAFVLGLVIPQLGFIGALTYVIFFDILLIVSIKRG